MNKYEKNLRITEKEQQGFHSFKNWLMQLNTRVTSVTAKPYGCHYDADVYMGSKLSKVEIKYMPQKYYNDYPIVTLNFYKTLPNYNQQADIFYLEYADDIRVSISKEQVDEFVKDYGTKAFIIKLQNEVEVDPKSPKIPQIQLAIPHETAGKYFTLYNGLNKLS